MHDEPIYTYKDLESWDKPGTHLAVIGHPIEHSISPLIHNTALEHISKSDPKFKHWHYHKFDIQLEKLLNALKLFHSKEFRGLNITAPLKMAAFQLIKEIYDTARPYNAINTLVFRHEGYKGYNTDANGLESSIKKAFGLSLKNLNVIVLGSGGAAATAAMHCIRNGCDKLYMGNCTPEKLDVRIFKFKAHSNNANIDVFNMSDPPRDLPSDALLINATPLGLKPEDPSPINLEGFGSDLKVLDLTYGKKGFCFNHKRERKRNGDMRWTYYACRTGN